jgi:hypothetical protein
VLGLLIATPLCALANPKSDFLIIGQARTLIIFNQYQQRATAQEIAELLPFTPFKILKANDVLGDGFTPCMKVEANGKVFYIEKDENGTLHGADQTGFQKMFRDATEPGDTIEIRRSNRLSLSDAQQTRTSALEQGSRVVRIFSHEGLTYVKLLGTAECYGWVNLSGTAKGRDWDIARLLGVSVADQLHRILPQVQLKVREINVKISRLFTHFNAKASQHQQPPQWQVQQSGATIICVLATNLPFDKFAETTRALSKSFDGILLGTDFRVVSKPGRIVLRR